MGTNERRECMRRFCFIFVVLMVGLMVSNAGAAVIWLGGTGNWSDPCMWDTGVAPISTTDEVRINNGTVNMDCSATIGMLRMCYAATTNAATLNLTAAAGFTGNTLTISKDTGELMSVGYLGAANVNQDTGTVVVHRTDANPVGEVRIVRNSSNPASYYNLSGGTLQADIIRGGFTGSNYGLNDDGGTIVTRNIYRLGEYDGTVMNWTQGGSTLSPGG